jgi:tetratricopeptide (TPR) repeat protein
METDREVTALHDAAVAAQTACDYVELERCARGIIQRSEAIGDQHGLAWGYHFEGGALFQRNDGEAAVRAYRKALDLFVELDDRAGAALVAVSLGAVALDVYLDVDEARRLYDRAMPAIRESGDKRRLAICLGNLGEIARLEGHPRQAIDYATEALTLFKDLDEPAQVGWQLTNVAHYHALLRHDGLALENLRAAYVELSREPIPRWIAWYFDVWFILAVEFEHWEDAATLLGFTDRYRDDKNVPRMQAMLPWFSLPVECLAKRARMDKTLDDRRSAGENLSLSQAHKLVETITCRDIPPQRP